MNLFTTLLALSLQTPGEIPPELSKIEAPVRSSLPTRPPLPPASVFLLEGQLEASFDESGIPVGFSLFNTGPNRIIPERAKEVGSGPDRQYSFSFSSRARQDIHLEITDTPNEYLSQRMESYIYLFPRRVLPAIERVDSESPPVLKVTLPTGEPVFFDEKTTEIKGGVLSETAPIDLGPNRFKRSFPRIQYRGSGTLIRVDRRGGDPRLGTIARIQRGAKTCSLPSEQLFNPDPHSSVEFLFETDEDFDSWMRAKCGFGVF